MDSQYYVDENGIIVLDIRSTKIADEHRLERVIRFIRQSLEKNYSLILLDLRNTKGMTKQAHKLVRQKGFELKGITAIAMIVGSPLSRLMASFYLGIFRPPAPIQLFDDRQEGIKWLLSQKMLPIN